MINYEEFSKVELKVAEVVGASRVEGSEKILKLEMELGDEKRQILAGIGKSYEPEGLVGKRVVIVANLEPKMIMGMESQGMILAALDEEGLAVVMTPDREVLPGAGLR